MASQQEVREYLAFWFQLGKKIVIRNGAESLLPQPVIQGDRYSPEFEAVWERIISPASGDCYLENTQQTIAELLTPAWQMCSCARCEMPVPIHDLGMPPELCPCHNLKNWPNTELPQPRTPVNTIEHLRQISDRLMKLPATASETN
jgi:hypothetical protein